MPVVRRGARAARLFFVALGCAAALATSLACSSGRVTAPRTPVTPFLDTLEVRTFQFFWQLANPRNGLVPDRAPSPSFSSVAAVGFGLTAYPIGVERGYVSRADARARALTTLRFLWEAPQGSASAGVTGYNGFFYHFLDMETGHRFETVELSTIDTALLLAGALVCQSYFTGDHPDEIDIRRLADSLYRRVNWPWAQPNPPGITLGWKPESGFIPYDYRGYNETMLLYILALGSPTFPVAPEAWTEYTSTYRWGSFHGEDHLGFAPLFGHQYSHVWIDFRGIQDSYMRGRGIDYFENSRRATYAQRAYAIANPMGWKGYGADVWGLTAADGPLDTTMVIDGRSRRFHTYWARGASFTEVNDDGTLAPTAAGGSIPFAPEIAIPALEAMRRRYGDDLFSTYGFVDSFNPTYDVPTRLQHGRRVPGVGWFDTDYLGIDQGPIVAMIENYRSDLVWRLMRGNPHVVRGLRRAGFTGGWLDTAPAAP
jgi:hypothetical protein